MQNSGHFKLSCKKFFNRNRGKARDLLTIIRKALSGRTASSANSIANVIHRKTSLAMRVVVPLDGTTAAAHPNNLVTNSRYTLWNFLPMNLFEQFRKPLNFYFLLVAALQFISVIAPVNPLSTLLPLLFAFTLTAVKEGYDDVKRHRQDSLYNNRRCTTLDPDRKEWRSIVSSQIRVGDVVKVRRDEEFPCDLVIVGAPLSAEGVIYIRTDNLDGELDLKPKEVVPIRSVGTAVDDSTTRDSESNAALACATSDLHPGTLANLLEDVSLVCPPPIASLDSFDARREIRNSGAAVPSLTLSLSAAHLVPQSCLLKHTEEVVGIAVYTGNETKCGMNKHDPPAKWAKIDQAVSHYSKVIFIFQLISACVMGFVGNSMNDDTESKGMWYLGPASSSAGVQFAIYQLRFFLLTTVMIPVSFKFVVDLSKQMMALVLEWDLAMYDDELGGGVKVRNSSIVEDLGQVEYILSDKTGTMTQNVMALKSMSLSGEVIPFPGNQLATTSLAQELEEFILCALLCNAVDVETALPPQATSEREPQQTETRPVYHSPSPDEEAIAYGMFDFGFSIVSRTKTEVILSARGKERAYRLLRVFPFSSEKKCMGVLVEEKTRTATELSSKVLLYVKGADDQVFRYSRQDPSVASQERRFQKNEEKIQQLTNVLDQFSTQGLRTLVFASREISSDEYRIFHSKFSDALIRLEGRQEACDALQESLMNGIGVLGVSAIEDKLQDDVKSSIETIIEANVRVWMLTGDKMETAEQIGLTCGLLNANDVVVRISKDASDRSLHWKERLSQAVTIYCDQHNQIRPSTNRQVGAAHRVPPTVSIEDPASLRHEDSDEAHHEDSDGLMTKSRKPHVRRSAASSSSQDLPTFVMIVQGGATLDEILQDGSLLQQFMKLALRAKSVICARVTPSQKAMITKQVSSQGFTTLAIGDGGNDVAMIQQAHVGVGICGKEGSQASRAADFSISKFSHLRSLMLYHGHASYARTAYVVQYSFYKSMLISFIQLVFNVFSTHMSGGSFWNSFTLTMWNGVYTLPQTLCYCLDRVAPRQVLERHPFLYRLSQRGADFNSKTFFGFVLRGAAQSAALYWLISQSTGHSFALPHSGFTEAKDITYTLAYSALVIHQVATVVIESNSMTIINLIVVFGMPVFYYFTVFAYSSIPSFAYYGVFSKSDNIQGFLFAFSIAAVLFLPHLAYSGFRSWWCPNPRVSMTLSKLGSSRYPQQAMGSPYVNPRERTASGGWNRHGCCGGSCWAVEQPSLYTAGAHQNEHSPLRIV